RGERRLPRGGEDAVAQPVTVGPQLFLDRLDAVRGGTVRHRQSRRVHGGEPADRLGQVDRPGPIRTVWWAAVALHRDEQVRPPAPPDAHRRDQRGQQHGVRGGAVGRRQRGQQRTGRRRVQPPFVVHGGGGGVAGRIERNRAEWFPGIRDSPVPLWKFRATVAGGL